MTHTLINAVYEEHLHNEGKNVLHEESQRRFLTRSRMDLRRAMCGATTVKIVLRAR